MIHNDHMEPYKKLSLLHLLKTCENTSNNGDDSFFGFSIFIIINTIIPTIIYLLFIYLMIWNALI